MNTPCSFTICLPQSITPLNGLPSDAESCICTLMRSFGAITTVHAKPPTQPATKSSHIACRPTARSLCASF